MDGIQIALVLLACGAWLMAGVYFTFSSFVMRSLATLSAPEGIRAMQAINRVILASTFMPVFFGTSAGALAAAGYVAVASPEVSGTTIASGSVCYLVGMFGCTLGFNVPLNKLLDRTSSDATDSAKVWNHYLLRWTRFNHLRTLASAAAGGLWLWVAIGP